MKTRRVFSAPDINTAEEALNAAIRAGIRPDHTALVGQSAIEMALVPDGQKEASPTDFVPAALRGIAGGGAIGLLGGLLGMAIPAVAIPVTGVVLTTLVGATVGGWSAALAGSAVPSDIRRDYEKEIEAGRLLVVIDEEDETVLERASEAVAKTGTERLKMVHHGLLH